MGIGSDLSDDLAGGALPAAFGSAHAAGWLGCSVSPSKINAATCGTNLASIVTSSSRAADRLLAESDCYRPPFRYRAAGKPRRSAGLAGRRRSSRPRRLGYWPSLDWRRRRQPFWPRRPASPDRPVRRPVFRRPRGISRFFLWLRRDGSANRGQRVGGSLGERGRIGRRALGGGSSVGRLPRCPAQFGGSIIRQSQCRGRCRRFFWVVPIFHPRPHPHRKRIRPRRQFVSNRQAQLAVRCVGRQIHLAGSEPARRRARSRRAIA